MSNKIIRIGIVGAGANTTSRHIPGLQSIDGVEIVSVCNRSRASSERVAQQFNIPKTYENWQELVQLLIPMLLLLAHGHTCIVD